MSQGTEPPPPMLDDVGRGRFGAVGDEDSLLSHVELAVGVVSSILRYSDLKKVDALSVEEALALLLQGTASERLHRSISLLFQTVNRLFLFLW